MRKQLDSRWKQIDKFEVSVKTYADTKAAWRRKLSAKEGELEAIKVCISAFLDIVKLKCDLLGYKYGYGHSTR